jgi:hypothetical protein
MKRGLFKNFKHKKIIFIIYLSLFFLSLPACCKDDSCNTPKEKVDKEESPLNIGNFALQTPQQPGPLLSFGQHIINENQSQFYSFADYFEGKRKHKVDIIPSILYGVTDDFSISFNVPIAANYKENKNHSSGWEDIFLQLEYAFYEDKTATFAEQATFVTSITFPTGSARKQPTTGFSSSSFFLGATFNRMYTDWFGFTSHGVLLTTSDEGTKFGNGFFYQFGLGRNILSVTSELIVSGMIEINGLYVKKDKIRKITDPNSGGNTVYITPSLWVSSKKLIVQLGFGLPATQHLFGNQKRNNYLLAANFGWTF